MTSWSRAVGPVGMAAALHARRAGLSVVVREPRSGPIDKACGEGLMPGAVAELADLGVHPRGRELTGIHYLDGTADRPGVTARFAVGPGRGVRRTVLHDALAQRVAEAGIEVDSRPVEDVRDAGDHLLVDGEPARYLIAADGLHSPVRRMLGLDAATARTPALRPALPRAAGAVDVVRRGPLVATGRGLRHAGGRRPGRRRRAQRRRDEVR